MAIRMLPDGCLELTRGGPRLDPDDRWLTNDEARRLARSAHRVIHHYYPRATDITADRSTVAALLGRVTSPASEVGDVGATRYSGAALEVLVLTEYH